MLTFPQEEASLRVAGAVSNIRNCNLYRVFVYGYVFAQNFSCHNSILCKILRHAAADHEKITFFGSNFYWGCPR